VDPSPIVVSKGWNVKLQKDNSSFNNSRKQVMSHQGRGNIMSPRRSLVSPIEAVSINLRSPISNFSLGMGKGELIYDEKPIWSPRTNPTNGMSLLSRHSRNRKLGLLSDNSFHNSKPPDNTNLVKSPIVF
jgi:hypothetical protein